MNRVAQIAREMGVVREVWRGIVENMSLKLGLCRAQNEQNKQVLPNRKPIDRRNANL